MEIHSLVVYKMAFGCRATHSFHPAAQPCVCRTWGMEHKGHSLLPALWQGGRRVEVQGSCNPEPCHGAVGGESTCWWGAGRGCELSSAEFST